MESFSTWGELASLALTVGFSTVRLAVAFLIVPIFSNEIMPALVRNSVFVSLALVVTVIQPGESVLALDGLFMLLIVAKEIFLGIAIGVFFSLFIWAFEAAGEVIDLQVGTAQAQLLDPISGHQVTLFSDLLARLINFVFMAVGGLSLICGITLQSFVLWPITSVLPPLEAEGVMRFIAVFAYVFTLALLLSAPFIMVCLLIDLGMGLVNRFAERLNVYYLSNSIKSLVVVILTLLCIPVLIEQLLDNLEGNVGEIEAVLRSLFH